MKYLAACCVITLAMPPHRPHKHHRDELRGTCAMKKYGSFRGFWKRYIHLCLWILYQGVNRSRLRWKTLHSSRTIDVRVQRVQQLLSDFSNCFMHHLKFKTVYHFRFVLHVSPNRRAVSQRASNHSCEEIQDYLHDEYSSHTPSTNPPERDGQGLVSFMSQ